MIILKNWVVKRLLQTSERGPRRNTPMILFTTTRVRPFGNLKRWGRVEQVQIHRYKSIYRIKEEF